MVTSSTQKLGTRYARPAYAERYPLTEWVDRKDAKGIHGNYRGVHWDRGAQQWRAQDLQGISVGFFDDLEANVEAAAAGGWDAVRIDHETDTAAQMRSALRIRGIL